MGLISRVSSRTYREVNKKAKMLARQIRPVLRSSLRAQSQTTNEHGGWVCKDRAEWEKYWPKIAEAQALHTAQMKQHISVNNQGKDSEKWQKLCSWSRTSSSLSLWFTASSASLWRSC